MLIGNDGATGTPVPLGEHEPIAFLGLIDGAPTYVAQAPDGHELTQLRQLAAMSDAATAGLVAYATSLAYFNRSHAFCGFCGAATKAGEGGHTRVCPNGHTHHPRTDPVVIMLVIDSAHDRVLLGRQPTWPERRYSALAGFVEQGEDLETAIAREVEEEAGVQVGAVRYIGSQPWPFPASLMLGFHADYVSGDPSPQDQELEDARWFSRAEVAAAGGYDIDFLGSNAPDEGELILPPKLAIARFLVDRWLQSS